MAFEQFNMRTRRACAGLGSCVVVAQSEAEFCVARRHPAGANPVGLNFALAK